MRRGSTARAAVVIVIALGAWAASAGVFTFSAFAQQGGATKTRNTFCGFGTISRIRTTHLAWTHRSNCRGAWIRSKPAHCNASRTGGRPLVNCSWTDLGRYERRRGMEADHRMDARVDQTANRLPLDQSHRPRRQTKLRHKNKRMATRHRHHRREDRYPTMTRRLSQRYLVPDTANHMICSGCGSKDIAVRPNWPSHGIVAHH